MDRTKHRSIPVDSFLSIENSLVMLDDENRMRSVPMCLIEIENENATEGQRKILDSHSVTADVVENQNGMPIIVKSEIDGFQATYTPGPRKDALRDTESTVPINIKNKPCATYGVPRNKTVQTENKVESKVIAARDSCKQSSVHVRFGSVEVHMHELQLGGSSVPMRGPSLSLKWERLSYQKYASVDEYQKENHRNRRSPDEMLLTSQQRVDFLLDIGYSMREVQSSVREAGTVRMKRLQSARYSSRNKFMFCLPKKLCACLKSIPSSTMDNLLSKWNDR